MTEGILNIFKPVGITSYDVIRQLKRVLGKPWPKIGHAGTLDPFAEGVLLVLLGRGATKLSSLLMGRPKIYEGVIRMGTQTDTDDSTGNVVERRAAPAFSIGDLRQAALGFVGEIEQVPPSFSALRWGGKRLYDLARAGRPVIPASRPVQIYEFELLSVEGERAAFRARVGRGVYLRSLARDFGRALGTVAHLESLTRTACGGCQADQAAPLDRLSSIQAIQEHLLDYNMVVKEAA